MDNYEYRYQLITGISLFKNGGNNNKSTEYEYIERSIYHFMKQMNEKTQNSPPGKLLSSK